MNEYRIAYEHSRYGYYTTEVEAESMLEAIEYFTNNYADGRNQIYSVTLTYIR